MEESLKPKQEVGQESAEIIEKAVQQCNEHYRGMIQVFEQFLEALEEKRNIDNLLVEVGNIKETETDPFAVGINDGVKMARRVFEGIKSENETREEAIDFFRSQIERIRSIINP